MEITQKPYASGAFSFHERSLLSVPLPYKILNFSILTLLCLIRNKNLGTLLSLVEYQLAFIIGSGYSP
ncbi:unnamed protein product [Caretta caretta]